MIKDKKWLQIDLNYESTRSFPILYYPKNPLIDPYFCNDWVNALHKYYNVDYSYGGMLENRSHLWRDLYLMKLSPPKPIHLGWDFNVPAGTLVYSPIDAYAFDCFYDPDQNGGWGGRLTLTKGIKSRELIIFAHLKNLNKNAEIKIGDVIGEVAGPEENGYWFPHLHLQYLNLSEWEGIDGYAEESYKNRYTKI